MGAFKYIPPDEVAKRYRTEHAPTPSRQPARPDSTPKQKNVEQVLSLGAVRYIVYRDRTFRIPPVPFKLGQRALALHVKVMADAVQVAKTGDREPADAYYKKIDQMAKLLWSHIRPIGRVRRVFWRLGLMRNPFRDASEAEMKAITDFFLRGRMTSSVRSMSEMEA